MSEASKSFEAGLRRLEEIVRRLESGDLPLEEALALFEEGTRLAKDGNALLDKAELKVARLMKGPDGAPVETEFETNG